MKTRPILFSGAMVRALFGFRRLPRKMKKRHAKALANGGGKRCRVAWRLKPGVGLGCEIRRCDPLEPELAAAWVKDLNARYPDIEHWTEPA